VARKRVRRGLINIVVFAASQSVEENWEDDTVERREGRGSAFILWTPLVHSHGIFTESPSISKHNSIPKTTNAATK
jgi:hypothetical protein